MATAPFSSVMQQLRTMVHVRAYEETSDRELLERFLAEREEAAFVTLLKRHGPMVLQVCRRIQGNEHDAEDVFQATFLLLARKAGSIRKLESVASWLHGVAHRLALEAKLQQTRRQAREKRVADMHKTSGISDQACGELQAILDEALQQVPQKYRAPLLLCYLEGKTQQEAAHQLGCPLGTVRSRLARGRDRLKEVLQRQGVCLSAAALAALLAESAAPAAVPPLLLHGTARAALAYAAGKAATALVSTEAVALLNAGLRAMTTVPLRLATAVVLAVGTLGLGAGIIASHGPSDPRPAAARAQPPTTALPSSKVRGNAPPRREIQENQAEITVRGRVLDSAGKPLPAARLLLLGKDPKPVEVGISGPDGQFTVGVPKDPKDHYLVAQTDGAGIDFINLGWPKIPDSVELRLIKDHVIRGRIVDTEGKPAAGVRVAVEHLGVYADNSLDSFLTEWTKRHFQSGLPFGVKHAEEQMGALFASTTDADGRFLLHGTGIERLVSLRLSGPGVADAKVWVVNRPGFDPKPYNDASRNNIPKGHERLGLPWLLYGPDLSLIVEAEKPIRGVVTAADTGKPRAGIEVWLSRNGDALLPLLLMAKTDAQGHYEIRGARKAQAYMVEVKSDSVSGYLPCQVRAADTPGYQPITAEIRVSKGVLITGRVIDKTTGKLVPGFAMVGVLSDNPFVKDYPEFQSSAWMHSESTTVDGTFRIVTIPGPVLLMGGPDYRRLARGLTETMKYKPPVPDPLYPQYFDRDLMTYYVPGGAISPLQGNFCKVLEIKPGTTVVEQDIVLEQARALAVGIQDAEGRSLSGVWVTGISPKNWTRPVQIEKDSCAAYDIEAGKPRLMVFYEPEKNLVGTLRLKGDEQEPVVAKLGPPGAVKGRLVGEDNKPVPGFAIEVFYPTREAQEMFEHAHRAKARVVTDANGTFQIDGLIPGVEFKLDHHPSGRAPRRANPLIQKLTVRPGETLPLGDLRAKPLPDDHEE